MWAWGSNYYGQLGLGIESQVPLCRRPPTDLAASKQTICSSQHGRQRPTTPGRSRSDLALPGPPCMLLPLQMLLILMLIFELQSHCDSTFLNHSLTFHRVLLVSFDFRYLPTILPKFHQQNRFIIDIAAGLHHRCASGFDLSGILDK